MKHKLLVILIVSILSVLSACSIGDKKVTVEASDEDITTTDETYPELQKDEPKDKDTYDIDYQANVDGVEINLEKLFITKDAIGLKSSFINNSEDNYSASPATYSLKINSNEIVGSSDIIYFNDSDNLTMEGRNTNYNSVSYWKLPNVDTKDIKTIDVQIDLVRDSITLGSGIVQFNRRLKLE
ncbi:hypothetical protein [Bacillus paralicheniformis]|uniref:hypothetical protein n=1 Tax=Bacillus paralicheniformis TaxID=1648923 RepID=UPI002243D276|nr:hypothetical protein [Bacillus paralicheniformis]MEC1023585.1 hypothetical protein [Bacillus paralicheniformis]MEC1027453.1 hypothetical protein [Bacillus paralicheniformis]MEC1034417.1 hypothetical protein [Bacillus paralicheniformis]MEC1050200.1 hypothetical protein [Bacillus paralicheniformis]MEC1059862.1 hypothetical protein [Bacillus paralicheniformis]